MVIGRQRWSRLVLLVITAVLVGSGLGTLLPSGTAATAAGEKSVKLAWFSTAPKDGTTVQTLAAKVSHVYLGSDKYGAELQAAGYDGQVMQYKLASEVEGPGPYANASAACNSSYVPLDNQIANKTGDFCRYLHPNESWFLHNGKGQRLVGEWNGRYYYHMNPASSGWQSFARQRLASELSSRGFDGVHLDNVELAITKAAKQLYNSDGIVKEHATETAFRSAWVSYLKVLSDALRSQWQVWANLVCDRNTGTTWEEYLPYLDGGMVEAFATGYSGLSADAWNKQLAQYESALRQGKSVIALSQGAKTDTTKQTFALASYLLITDGQQAYFRYSNSQSYTQFWDYPNYGVALGAAKGGRYLTGTTWRRDFANGYVVVDPAARTGKIVMEAPTDPTPTPEPAPTRVALPGKIEAEDYKTGGKGIGYHDTTSGNNGNVYRSDDVDIERASEGGYTVGWIAAGEWLAYDVAVNTSGDYEFRFRVATDRSGKTVRLLLDGQAIGTTITVPNTGGWQAWADVVSVPVRLSAGNHELRVVTDTGSFNLNYVQVEVSTPSSTAPATAEIVTAPEVEFRGVSDGQTVSGSINVEAVVTSDAFDTDNVKFQLDGAWVGTEGTAPYFLGGDANGQPNGFDTRQWSNGSHVLTAVAIARDGKTIESQITIDVQNAVAVVGPVVRLKGVSNGQTVSGRITVEALVENGEFDTRSIRFYLDGAWVGTEGTAPYFLGGDDNGQPNGFDTRQWSNGSHALKAVATDRGGKTIESQITIKVAN